MRAFLAALSFLTAIPLKSKHQIDEKNLALSVIYFPLIGLILGLMLAGLANVLLLIPLEQGVVSVILVVALVILTGGLHLDGLADSCDALLSYRNKERIFEIMHDPHIGTMGTLGLMCVLLLKAAFISALGINNIKISLILMCLLARYALVFSMYVFPYARQSGKAGVFIKGTTPAVFSLASLISLGITMIIFGLKGLIVFLSVIVFVFIINKLISKKIGGVTGDTLGALSELTEVFVLFAMLVL